MRLCFLVPALKALHLVIGYYGGHPPSGHAISWYFLDRWCICEQDD